MAGMIVDASELTALGRRLTLAQTVSHTLIAATVKKAAQNVKDAINEDVGGSSNGGLAQVRVAYETGSEGNVEYADVSPRDSGASNLANIAFFGTARGGGTHEFYGHAAEELPTLADYVGDAAGAALDALIWG